MAVDFSWVLTILVALVTWYLASHWMKTKALPPGPFPLPIVGNLLSFRKIPMKEAMKKYRERYGGVFTLWFGNIPYVIIMDHNLVRQALLEKRTDFAGRPEIPLVRRFLKDSMNISSVDYSRQWEVLRKMAHFAIRKYAASERLPPLIDDLTEETVEEMVQQKSPFNPKEYIYYLIFNIIACTVLGQRYAKDDPDFVNFRDSIESLQKYMGKGILGHFMPILRPFLTSSQNEMVARLEAMREFLKAKINQSVQTYQPTNIRSMIDSLLEAREALVKELGEENTLFLNDGNMFQVLRDIFGAGIDTTNSTIRWLMLYVTMYPDIQEKIIQEVRDNIGDRIPTQDDRKNCPYTMAAITEIMRLQAVAPLGVPHKTMKNTELGGKTIPEGTACMFNYGSVHEDEQLWPNAEKFLPERFLEANGSLKEVRQNQFMPFGLGRRSCVGEKLAIEVIFLVVVGLFRRCRLTLEDPPKDLNSETVFFQVPKKHSMLATRL